MEKCTRCKIRKKNSQFDISSQTKRLFKRCRECRKAAGQVEKVLVPDGMKQCSKCEGVKVKSEFDVSNLSGKLFPRCKVCRAASTSGKEACDREYKACGVCQQPFISKRAYQKRCSDKCDKLFWDVDRTRKNLYYKKWYRTMSKAQRRSRLNAVNKRYWKSKKKGICTQCHKRKALLEKGLCRICLKYFRLRAPAYKRNFILNLLRKKGGKCHCCGNGELLMLLLVKKGSDKGKLVCYNCKYGAQRNNGVCPHKKVAKASAS